MELHASSDEESEAEAKEEEGSEARRRRKVCDRTKTASAKVEIAGGEQGCVGEVLQATAAGG
jgi:hypothetical protein